MFSLDTMRVSIGRYIVIGEVAVVIRYNSLSAV